MIMRRALALALSLLAVGLRASADPSPVGAARAPLPGGAVTFADPEERLISLKLATEKLLDQGKQAEAASMELELARTYGELGLVVDQHLTLMAVVQHAPQGPLRDAARGFRLVVEAKIANAGRALHPKSAVPMLHAWNQLADAAALLPRVAASQRDALATEIEKGRFETIIAVADRLCDWRTDCDLLDPDPEQQLLLLAIFRGVKRLPKAPGPTANDLGYLAQQRPFRSSLVQRAKTLQAALQGRAASSPPGPSKDLADARSLVEGGVLDARSSDYPQAVHEFLDAGSKLDLLDRYDESFAAIEDAVDLLHWGQFDDPARATATKVIGRIEQVATSMDGYALDYFLDRYRITYAVLYDILKRDYDTSRVARAADANRVLIKFLWHADRMNFRGLRRDQLPARDELSRTNIATPDDALLLRLGRKEYVFSSARTALDRARDQGKTRDDFAATADRPAGGPFFEFTLAKRNVIDAFEDVQRRKMNLAMVPGLRVFKRGSVEGLDGTLENLQATLAGMAPDQAILMYIQEPLALLRGRDPHLLAAVIEHGGRSVRLVDLGESGEKDLGSLRAGVTDMVALASTSGQGGQLAGLPPVLKQLSNRLLLPLKGLPRRLTILLTPNLIGIPFESLPDSDGLPLIARHTVRYAFGLQGGLGNYESFRGLQRAMVLGSERSAAGADLELPSSRAEVQLLRSSLVSHGLAVMPASAADALPFTGQVLLDSDARVDILHVSAHSHPDRTEPLMDGLAFPDGDLVAYRLGLSKVRARLAVLSACELFAPRTGGTYGSRELNPVSGLTTTVLSDIAPNVVSTLWKVNAETTRVFMQRFYAALLATEEPAEALAVTKRDFLDPKRLAAWMQQSGLPKLEQSTLASYAQPAYWAPFVLVLGVPSAEPLKSP